MDGGLFPVTINNTVNLNYNMQVLWDSSLVLMSKNTKTGWIYNARGKQTNTVPSSFLKNRSEPKPSLPFLFKSPFYHLLYLISLQAEQSMLCWQWTSNCLVSAMLELKNQIIFMHMCFRTTVLKALTSFGLITYTKKMTHNHNSSDLLRLGSEQQTFTASLFLSSYACATWMMQTGELLMGS